MPSSRDDELLRALTVARNASDRRALEEQLRHIRKMDSVGRLTGGVVHDINNMLAAIGGAAAVLTRALDDRPELVEMANTITRAVDRAGALTQNLLAFSRRPTVDPIRFDLHEVIEAACALLAPAIDRSIEIELRLAASLHTGVGDPSQLQNALLNLGFNSRDAMPDGGAIRIETRDTELDAFDCSLSSFDLEPGSYVEVDVSDTGSGMDEETARRAFEPFFTTKEVGRGTGLGLAAVRDAVVEHHGAVRLVSRPGHGTTCRLLLPVVCSGRPAGTVLSHPEA
jgi:signal transduction histidine kinase